MELSAPLDQWFCDHAAEPEGTAWLPEQGSSYAQQYSKCASDLNRYVHPEVTKGSISTDQGFLTDHGPEHIKVVIRRATEILKATQLSLTRYEAYILLMSIHLHDTGNAFGRAGHESAAQLAMNFLGDAAGRNAVEKRVILRIARAHGGQHQGNKDTIAQLIQSAHISGREIRPRLLASILRLADELAEEPERSSDFILSQGGMPPKAEIYHHYARCLHSTSINHPGSSIKMDYELDTPAIITKQFEHEGKQKFLLDYIFERTVKTHNETRYCMRFLRPHVSIESIVVTIQIYKGGIDPFRTIAYKLEERGYPDEHQFDIYEHCREDLHESDGHRIDGEHIAHCFRADSLPAED